MQLEHREANFYRCDLAVRARNLLHAGRRYIHFYPVELPPSGIGFEPWRVLTTWKKPPEECKNNAGSGKAG
jgi:hypothetical protein